jgi:phosphatidate cytidylyltransferase
VDRAAQRARARRSRFRIAIGAHGEPMPEAARSQFLWVLAAVTAVLLFASIVARLLLARAGGCERAPALANLDARIRSWWVIVALLASAMLLGPTAVTVVFAVTSAMALSEFIAHAPRAVRDPVLDAGCYALTVLQYALVASGSSGPVMAAMPLAAALGLPIAATASGGNRELQSRIAHRFWWVIIASWCLSFVPALLLLEVPGYHGRNVLLIVYLVVVTQSSDVLQYVFGKLYGRHPIAPAISPGKTVEGFVGGIAAATALGTALSWLTPFSPWHAVAVSVAVTLLGFLGGLLLSGIKRDLGIKDWGQSIKGHGGVLDRVDSLCLSAPAFFFIVYALCT